jgi:hypothetical protein
VSLVAFTSVVHVERVQEPCANDAAASPALADDDANANEQGRRGHRGAASVAAASIGRHHAGGSHAKDYDHSDAKCERRVGPCFYYLGGGPPSEFVEASPTTP